MLRNVYWGTPTHHMAAVWTRDWSVGGQPHPDQLPGRPHQCHSLTVLGAGLWVSENMIMRLCALVVCMHVH